MLPAMQACGSTSSAQPGMDGIQRPVYRFLGARGEAAALVLALHQFFETGDHDVDAFSLTLPGKTGRRNAVGISLFIDPILEAPGGVQGFVELAACFFFAIEKGEESGAERYGCEQDVLDAVEHQLALEHCHVPQKHPTGDGRLSVSRFVWNFLAVCRHRPVPALATV